MSQIHQTILLFSLSFAILVVCLYAETFVTSSGKTAQFRGSPYTYAFLFSLLELASVCAVVCGLLVTLGHSFEVVMYGSVAVLGVQTVVRILVVRRLSQRSVHQIKTT